jgi:hypothetical protein
MEQVQRHRIDYRLVALTALSMSLGWRIRGQFGHELGAAIAGALGGLAIVLLAGREDWLRRAHYFAFFGALGWSFGGSMSYMKVVQYCHSSDSATALYGFAGLFFLGFLWASLGGAGTALPAVLDREQLNTLFPAIAAVFGAWFLQDIVIDLIRMNGGSLPQLLSGDWIAALAALAAALLLAMVRRRIDLGISLVLHMAIGWCIGFFGLVGGLGLHLNPPRGDNWAGCVGLVGGMLVFCHRHRLTDVKTAAIVTGLIGAVGFCLGQILKLVLIAGGRMLPGITRGDLGEHCVMEWLHGLFFGIAAAIAMGPLIRKGPALVHRVSPRWIGMFSMFFLMWIIPYLNSRRSPPRWLQRKFIEALPEYSHGIAVVSDFLPSRGWIGWFEAVYLVAGAGLLWFLYRHLDRPFAFIPESWLGRSQILYLSFVWLITFLSVVHVTPELRPLELWLQVAILFHALVCTMMMLSVTAIPGEQAASQRAEPAYVWGRTRIIMAGVLAIAGITFAGWGVQRLLLEQTSGYTRIDQIRFGPNNTNDLN